MTHHRLGSVLVESCAACVLLMAALGMIVPLLTSAARQRQESTFDAQAMIVADNVLERLTGEPYDAITADQAREVASQSEIADLLPDGKLQIEISDAAGLPRGKRIQVDVTWKSTGDSPALRRQLVTWVYQIEGQK